MPVYGFYVSSSPRALYGLGRRPFGIWARDGLRGYNVRESAPGSQTAPMVWRDVLPLLDLPSCSTQVDDASLFTGGDCADGEDSLLGNLGPSNLAVNVSTGLGIGNG